jgi:hypothetical protein
MVSGGGGSSDTGIFQPDVGDPPEFKESVAEFTEALPDLINAFETLLPQVAQAQIDTQNLISPELTTLEQTLTDQAIQGSQSLLPPSLKAEFLDTFRSAAGENAAAPIGADFISRGILNETLRRQDASRALGLDLLSRRTPVQPLPFFDFQPSLPANFNAQNFATKAAGERPVTTQSSRSFQFGLF